MTEHRTLAALLGAVGILLCIGFVFSVRLTEQISHAARAEAQPAAHAQTKHG